MRINRRAGKLATAFAALAASIALAACGGGSVGGVDESQDVTVAEGGDANGALKIANWPGYIDPGDDGSIAEFQDKTGIDTSYIEEVNDNAGFFGKVQPQLSQGESGDRSIMVVTDWMAKQMYDLGYLQSLDKDKLTTVYDNLRGPVQSTELDPDRSYSIPWQSGMTGIWVNKAEAPEITSVNDLFDPKYKGRVTMLTDLHDTVPLVMKADGIDPTEATKEDWLAAIDKIKEAADSGQIRRFTGNDYTEDITSGNAVASIGWSGDASLISNPDAEWVMPEDGCMLWTDNMVIPVGAPNPAAAYEFMNFAYDPEVQADITEWVTYVTPVDGVQEVLEKRGSKAADDQLVFPSDEFTADCTTQVIPPGDAEEVDEVTKAFQDVISG